MASMESVLIVFDNVLGKRDMQQPAVLVSFGFDDQKHLPSLTSTPSVISPDILLVVDWAQSTNQLTI